MEGRRERGEKRKWGKGKRGGEGRRQKRIREMGEKS